MVNLTIISLLLLASSSALTEQEPRYACPEVNVDFEGNDVEILEDVASWHNCGKFLNMLKAQNTEHMALTKEIPPITMEASTVLDKYTFI